MTDIIEEVDLSEDQKAFTALMQKIQHKGILENDKKFAEIKVRDLERLKEAVLKEAEEIVAKLGSDEVIIKNCTEAAQKGHNKWNFYHIPFFDSSDKERIKNDFIKEILKNRGFVCKQTSENFSDDAGGYNEYYLSFVWNT